MRRVSDFKSANHYCCHECFVVCVKIDLRIVSRRFPLTWYCHALHCMFWKWLYWICAMLPFRFFHTHTNASRGSKKEFRSSPLVSKALLRIWLRFLTLVCTTILASSLRRQSSATPILAAATAFHLFAIIFNMANSRHSFQKASKLRWRLRAIHQETRVFEQACRIWFPFVSMLQWLFQFERYLTVVTCF